MRFFFINHFFLNIILKILIVHYSEMGNIEKIARAIKNAIESVDVDLIPIKEVDPISLISSDLIFLGSGIYGFNVNRKITKIIKKCTRIMPISCL